MKVEGFYLSVLNFVQGEQFTVTTYKNFNTVPLPEWVNTWELVAVDDGTAGDLITVAHTISVFESKLLCNNALVSRAVVRTWDSDGRNQPGNFISTTQNVIGQKVPGVDPLPITQAWYIKRSVQSGRYGKLELRNNLTEAEVGTINGVAVFANPSAKQVELQNAMDDSSLSNLFSADTSNLVISLVAKFNGGIVSRRVTGLVSDSCRTIKHDHKYFDRRNTP